jgi:hypothetical protein
MTNIYKEIADKYNLPIEVIKTAYEYYYSFIREKISELPLKGSIEDLDNIKTSFNIPSIGKLYCNKNKLNKIKDVYDRSCK